MTFSKSRILILVIIVAAIGYWLVSRKSAQAVNLGSVTRGDVLQRVTVAGAIAPNKRSIITAPFRGYVQKLYVKLGQQVKEGQPLFSLSESLASPENNHPIRAPFSGTVVQVLKSEGEYVKDNDLSDFVLRVDDFSKFFVLAEAPEIEAIRLKEGQEAIIRAAAVVGRSYKGAVREISLAAKTEEKWSRSQQVIFHIKIEVLDADQSLRSGMSVLVDVVAEKRTNVLTLQNDYINKEKEEYFVITADNQRKVIKIGLRNESITEILEGVSENEKVQAVDFLKLAEGQNEEP